MQPAENLRDAFNLLNHREPVRPEQIPFLFVKRAKTPTNALRVRLQLSKKPQKILFVGHRGSGKSSELAYLKTLIDDEFLAIFIPIYDIFQAPVVTHTEIIFAMLVQLLKVATDENIVPAGVVTTAWEALLQNFLTPAWESLFGTQTLNKQTTPNISVKLSILVTELEAKIGESYTRNQVKEVFSGKIHDLLRNMNDLSRQLEQKTKRRLLLIVEGIDKLDPKTVRQLFTDHARTLTAPYPSLIYTFPIAERYNDQFHIIEQNFDGAHILSNIALKHRDQQPDREGQYTFIKILHKRLIPELFAKGVMDQLIHISGGHVKTLIDLGHKAIIQAVVDSDSIIQKKHLQQAIRETRDDYIAFLRQEQLDLLLACHKSEDKGLDDISPDKQALLFNGSLLEYSNTIGPWADINPIVVELLERHEQKKESP